MDYLTVACQFKKKIFVLVILNLFILSCANKNEPEANIGKTEAKPNWFSKGPKYSHKNLDGDIESHLFFDLVPFEDFKDDEVNFVTLTPKDSKYQYDLDLYSGKRFKRHNYCSQRDVWKDYGGVIDTPNFSIGVIPRLLDQLGLPQKIIVFGDNKYLGDWTPASSFSQRAKIIGGYVEQYCEQFPCHNQKKWLSRLVLIGVHYYDPVLNKIGSVQKLKEYTNWEYVMAFLQNAKGRNIDDKEDKPAYRVIGALPAKEALKAAFSKGKLFGFKEMSSMRDSCYKLYDYIWDGVKKVRSESKKKNSMYSNFSEYFKIIYSRHRGRIDTCSKFVRDSSINNNSDRAWFFAYLNGFLKLESLGYYFDCSKQRWVRNIFNRSKGRYVVDFVNSKKSCTTKALDKAFETSITILSAIAHDNAKHFKYLEYDNIDGGSHQKLFSWIEYNGKVPRCDKVRERGRHRSIFPKDINWAPFGKNKDNNLIK